MKKGISILGSTGSIGRQTLEVVSVFPASLKVVGLAAKNDVPLLVEQIKKFSPKLVSVLDEKVKSEIEKRLTTNDLRITTILTGDEGLIKVATVTEAKMVVVAIPGIVSLIPTLEAIRNKKNIALASKEVLVAAGEIVMEEIVKNGVKIYPIDSEHSALSQCLRGEEKTKVKRMILTASGGPFLNTSLEKFPQLTAKEALKHPTWKMGSKVTIDSATLMNKGFEVIEAHYLFGLDYSQIEVLIHPQSIIHSMVEFIDGAIKAQLAAPDMRIPIQYALFEEERISNLWQKIDWGKISTLTFLKPDKEKFPCLEYAYRTGQQKGTLPAVLNAANEEVVNFFLQGKINFAQIPSLIKLVIDQHVVKENPTLEEILSADQWARKVVGGVRIELTTSSV